MTSKGQATNGGGGYDTDPRYDPPPLPSLGRGGGINWAAEEGEVAGRTEVAEVGYASTRGGRGYDDDGGIKGRFGGGVSSPVGGMNDGYNPLQFYDQLQRERAEWAEERGRMLRVIELQQVRGRASE